MTHKLAIVTGDSSGLGKSLRDALLKQNWFVVGISRRASVVDHKEYLYISADLSELELSQEKLGDKLSSLSSKDFDQVALVNNAGTIQPVLGLSKIPGAELAKAVTLNLTTPMWLTSYVLDTFSHSQIKVVNISSGAATKAYEGWGTYCSTKAALRMASQVLAAERPDVQVLSYAPGVIDTPMQEEVRGSAKTEFPNLERFIGLHENGQLVKPELPAHEICDFLNSEASEANYHEYRYGDKK